MRSRQSLWVMVHTTQSLDQVLTTMASHAQSRAVESCHTYGRVMSHIWMSHVTHMDESCHTYGRVMSHIWTSHVTHMDESCHTYGRVMSHVWMSRVTRITRSWVTWLKCARHVHMCDMTQPPMTRSYEWCDSTVQDSQVRRGWESCGGESWAVLRSCRYNRCWAQ